MSGMFSDVERPCLVESRQAVADGVVLLALVAANGRDLPPWEPGSHVDLLLSNGGEVLERQYSLCGDPADRSRYQVAVLREVDGRGGSDLVHDRLNVGEPVRIRGPRNHFAFEPAAGVPIILLAGGIGITPFVAMTRAADEQGRPLQLHYAGRSRATMAFCAELEDAYGDRVVVHAGDEGSRLDVSALVNALPADAELWACGPKRLVEQVEQEWGDRPPGALHVERFEAKEFGPPVRQEPFEVELALTGVTVEVGLDRSVLDAVEAEGVLVVSSCRKGTCGTCETPVLEGDIEHRDSILTPEDRDAGDTMMICVSRSLGDRLVLDL